MSQPLTYHGQYRAELRAWKRSHGLCLDCMKSAQAGTVRCEECRIQHNQRTARRVIRLRQERKALGLCGSCGGPGEDGYADCSSCRQKIRARHRKALQRGVCGNCRGVLADSRFKDCQACREARAARRRAARREARM